MNQADPSAKAELRAFFIAQLNLLYCAKCHLTERLTELQEDNNFGDLQLAMSKTTAEVSNEISILDMIYKLLGADYTFDNCGVLIEQIEDIFSFIRHCPDNPLLRDLSILYYMRCIKNVELTSSKILQIAAEKLKSKQINRLLKKSFFHPVESWNLADTISLRYA